MFLKKTIKRAREFFFCEPQMYRYREGFIRWISEEILLETKKIKDSTYLKCIHNYYIIRAKFGSVLVVG